MVGKVRLREQQKQAKYDLANDTVHVGQIPSVEAPHRDEMTEECLKQRFSEFGEVLTVVKCRRPSTKEQVHNSWALVVFKNPDSVRNMLNGKAEIPVPAKRPDGSNGKLVRVVDSESGVGWSHCVRRIDPVQAREGKGSFGAVFDKCFERVHGNGTTGFNASDSSAGLKTIAEELRQKVAEMTAISNHDSDETSDPDKWDGGINPKSPMPKAYQQIMDALRSDVVDTKTLQDAIAASVGDTLVPGARWKPDTQPQPEPDTSFWTFGNDSASSTPGAGAGGLNGVLHVSLLPLHTILLARIYVSERVPAQCMGLRLPS